MSSKNEKRNYTCSNCHKEFTSQRQYFAHSTECLCTSERRESMDALHAANVQSQAVDDGSHSGSVFHSSLPPSPPLPLPAVDDGSRSASPSSLPSTPSSPLPVSFRPGNQTYSFLMSPSSFPPVSSHASAENHPLLQVNPGEEPKSTCLKDMLEWFIQRCCCCCSTTN